MNKQPKVAVIMGSDSDFPALKACISYLKKMDTAAEVFVMSAHRTPDKAAEFAASADKNGFDCLIAAAGKAAHLAGVLAAHTVIPVIGVPIKASTLDGLDALLSTVQMPKGIPVATVAIDGGDNAAILAAQILALKYDYLKEKLYDMKKEMAEGVEEKNNKIKELAEEIR